MSLFPFALFARVREDAILPEYANAGDSGLDIYIPLADHYALAPGETRLIPIGWKICPPTIPLFQVEFQIRPRSGLSLNTSLRIANSPGTIDASYRGEIGILAENIGATILQLDGGMKIAQLVCCPIVRIKTKVIPDSEFAALVSSRGMNGFGSTGRIL